MSKTLNQNEILDYIPHRNENVLLDSCVIEEGENKGTHVLELKEGDTRQLFLKEKKKGEKVLLATVAAEIIALSSIVSYGGIASDELAIFAAITSFKKEGDLVAAFPYEGRVDKIREKAGFFQFSGSIQSGSGKISCQVMAYYAKRNEILNGNEDKKRIEVPQFTCDDVIAPALYKDPVMSVLDKIRLKGALWVGEYRYPETHPFVKGHFPDNPVMMGVMQWMMLEDLVTVWSKEQDRKGQYSIHCSAEIIKADGTVVCEIKNAIVDVCSSVDGVIDQAEIRETKKVVFRDMVKPGETLFILSILTN